MIKERCGTLCRIFETNYDSSYAKIVRLVEEAKRDFPDLADSDIRIVVYSGNRHKRMIGIEFVAVNRGLRIDNYTFVNDFDFTFN